MSKSATDVMQEILFSAVIDSVVALKDASKGVPNTMLRDINAIHANTTFGDLPKELQAGITSAVRAAFTRLLKEGYAVAAADQVRARTAPSDSRGGRPDSRGHTDRPSRRPPGKPGGGGPGRPNGDRGPRGGRGPGSRPRGDRS